MEEEVDKIFDALATWMETAEAIILNFSSHRENCLVYRHQSCSCGFSLALYNWKMAEAQSKEIFIKFNLKEDKNG